MRDLLVLPKLGMKLGDLPIIIKEHTSLLHTDITSSHVAVHSQDGANREGNAFFIDIRLKSIYAMRDRSFNYLIFD